MIDSNAKAAPPRILSLDQFRGYTVAGMFAVNFLGDYWRKHPVFTQLEHHNNYFSFADSIMPQFFFAVGFAFRLTMLRRLESLGAWRARRQAVRRGLGLILLSLMLFPPDRPFKVWREMREQGVAQVVGDVVKSGLWETLALIGATSILVMPAIAANPSTRIGFMAVCAVIHVVIAQTFNFHWVAGKPSLMDHLWPQVARTSSFDGGPFGLLMWAMPMLAGSLAYDLVAAGAKRAAPRLFGWAIVLMASGYALSCLTTLYAIAPAAKPTRATVAASPVLPPTVDLSARDWRSLLAEPPFHPPPSPPQRDQNYWTMSKKHVTLPFMLFATGFSAAVYGLFVLLCDLASVRVGLFHTFGQNALAGYIIHEFVMKAVKAYTPADSPLYWILAAFAVFFAITWLFVRYLEKSGIHLKM